MLLLENRFLLLLGALSALPACGTNEARPSTGVYVLCHALWFGALPEYTGQSVIVRACLNESTCTDEYLLTAERGVTREYENFSLESHFYPSGSGNYIGDEEYNLGVSLFYAPEFATTLADDDRATLLVKGEDGNTMIDSVAVPYEDDVATLHDGNGHCKSLYLRLDGSARPFPTSNPNEALPSR